LKILTVVGARPQFVKAGPVSKALVGRAKELLVHTGQHYDMEMSDVFFRELQLKTPDYNLEVGSASHAVQTGEMLKRIEQVLIDERPDLVLVYGDTNSTLAGALAAAKLGVPVAHVEAGLRSFNRAMPEEINRVLTDHLASVLFTPSPSAEKQLQSEGVTSGVHVVGDVMYDAVLQYRPLAAGVSHYPRRLGLGTREFYLCTVHRAENTDDRIPLAGIFSALDSLDLPVIVPLHPRTRKKLVEFGIVPGSNVVITDPVGYLDMLQLLQTSAVALTDSGGLQKEAFYVGVPCVTLRAETEWTETVDAGWNRLAGYDAAAIVSAVEASKHTPSDRPELYGDGAAASRIATILTGLSTPDVNLHRATAVVGGR